MIRPPAHFDDYIVYSAVTRTLASTQLVDTKTRASVDRQYIVPQELKQRVSSGQQYSARTSKLPNVVQQESNFIPHGSKPLPKLPFH